MGLIIGPLVTAAQHRPAGPPLETIRTRQDGNSRENVQNVRGVHHELRSPRSMKMDLVVMSRSSHNLLWNRTHFLSRQLR
jgi:hypothetical protein